jgi:hypothetical protein
MKITYIENIQEMFFNIISKKYNISEKELKKKFLKKNVYHQKELKKYSKQ